MARTRKGRAVSGWLVVDKPAGVTSTDVVNKVKWAFGAQKAGHAGTLDPAATGVLAVALGEATKTVPYITDALKCYRFVVTLGAATTTDDAEGAVTATATQRPADADIAAALARFRGDIQQIPPQFSAVKVDGARAYDLARDGEALDLAARPLFVDRLDLIARPDADHVELEMVCGKGGYVRSIARDLGQALGCLGHVLWLRRTWSGPFHASDGITMTEIERLAKTEALDTRLRPLELGLPICRNSTPRPRVRSACRMAIPARHRPASALWLRSLGSHQGRAIAVGHYRGGELHPTRVFA